MIRNIYWSGFSCLYRWFELLADQRHSSRLPDSSDRRHWAATQAALILSILLFFNLYTLDWFTGKRLIEGGIVVGAIIPMAVICIGNLWYFVANRRYEQLNSPENSVSRHSGWAMPVFGLYVTLSLGAFAWVILLS